MAKLDDRHVSKAKRLVFQKFPEMAGATPSVAEKRFQSKTRQGTEEGEQRRYVVTFEKDVSLPGGSQMKRRVRVTMDGGGDVLRLTSSK